MAGGRGNPSGPVPRFKTEGGVLIFGECVTVIAALAVRWIREKAGAGQLWRHAWSRRPGRRRFGTFGGWLQELSQ